MAFSLLDDDTTTNILRFLDDDSLTRMRRVCKQMNTLAGESYFWLQRLIDHGFDRNALIEKKENDRFEGKSYFSPGAYKKIYQNYKRKLKFKLMTIDHMEAFEPVFLSGDITTVEKFVREIGSQEFKEEHLLHFACLPDDPEFNIAALKLIFGEVEFYKVHTFEKMILAAFKTGNYLLAGDLIGLARARQMELSVDKIYGLGGWNILHCAFRSGSLPCVEFALSLGISPHIQTHSKTTILHCAIDSGNIQVVTKALAIVKEQDVSAEQLLPIAIETQSTELVDYLISKLNLNTQATDENGMNALHHAFQTGNMVMIEKVLSFGIDLQLKTKSGASILTYAIISGSIEAVECALKLLGLSSLAEAFKTQPELAMGVSLAARCGHINMIRHCIAAGYDINSKDRSGMTLLHRSFQYDYGYELVDELIKLGANPNLPGPDGNLLIHYAAGAGNPILVNKALEFTPANALNEKGQNALFFTNNAKVVKLLIDNGADINVCDVDGLTPLLNAEEYDPVRFDSCTVLLAQPGLDKSAVDAAGWDALDRAVVAENCSSELLHLLVTAGFQVANKVVPLHGISAPLAMLAVWGGNFDKVQRLVDLGMDIHCKDSIGRNVLFPAIKNATMFQRLLSHYDIDPLEPNNAGHCVYDVVCSVPGLEDIKDIIEAHVRAKKFEPVFV